MVQRKAASIPHILCFLGQHYAHSIQSGAPGRADPPRPPSRGRRDRVSEGPQSTTDGTEGLAHTQEQEESSERSLQKGSARQKVTRASSPIPNESFGYQAQFLALSKARAEALPAPCPLGAEEATGAAAARPQPPWGLIHSRTLSRPPCWFEPGRILQPAKQPYTFPSPSSGKAWSQSKPS